MTLGNVDIICFMEKGEDEDLPTSVTLLEKVMFHFIIEKEAFGLSK